MFQSTPVIADERMGAKAAASAKEQKFQSTPVIADERMQTVKRNAIGYLMFQSTPVIADERMVPHSRLLQSGPSFNPRPSLLTSEWRHAVTA